MYRMRSCINQLSLTYTNINIVLVQLKNIRDILNIYNVSGEQWFLPYLCTGACPLS